MPPGLALALVMGTLGAMIFSGAIIKHLFRRSRTPQENAVIDERQAKAIAQLSTPVVVQGSNGPIVTTPGNAIVTSIISFIFIGTFIWFMMMLGRGFGTDCTTTYQTIGTTSHMTSKCK